MSKFPIKWLVGGAIIAVAGIAIGSLQLGENVAYFYTPSEAIAKAADLDTKTIKLGGMVKVGSVVWNAENLDLNFVVHDMKGNEIKVSHRGAPPDMFKEASGVVVEGRLASNGGSIASQRLMVKHSEEYKKPDAGHSMDRELLEKSLFKE